MSEEGDVLGVDPVRVGYATPSSTDLGNRPDVGRRPHARRVRQPAAKILQAAPASRRMRALEIGVAVPALLVMAPIILLIAIVIRLDSPGPALFFQQRLGAGGVPFRFVKFRTLYADARTRFPELYSYRYTEEQVRQLRFKVENDPRVTRVGHWLRQSSLDELPNFYNVLTGDMALVGPRPEIPEMLLYYTGEMLEKFLVRPGVTGLAQTSGRGRLGFLETVDLDVRYVRTRTLWGDIRIFARTIRMVFLRDGAF